MEHDPGWQPAARRAPMAGVRALLGRNPLGSGDDGLVRLRSTFLAFVAVIFAVGVVVAVLESVDGLTASVDAGPAVAGVAVVAAALVAGSELVGRRQLERESPEALAGSFTSRFVLRLALSEAAAMFGFVGYILSSAPTAYVVGGALALVGLARLAPTRSRVDHESDQLAATGCPHRLRPALRDHGLVSN